MTYLNGLFLAALVFLGGRQLISNRSTVKWLSRASIPIAILGFVVISAVIWLTLMPDNINDSNRFVLLGVIQTALATIVAGYVGMSLRGS